jgi:hypothetical protein
MIDYRHIKGVFTMYRPTVRYDDVYRDYVGDVFHATTLDRNQIIRLALFVAANSQEYNAILSEYKKADVSTLPHAKWQPDQSPLWQGQSYSEEKGGTSHVIDGRKTSVVSVADVNRSGGTTTSEEGKVARREGEIQDRIKATGGITFKVD